MEIIRYDYIIIVENDRFIYTLEIPSSLSTWNTNVIFDNETF